MASKGGDKYANFAAMVVLQAAANVEEFKLFQFPYSVTDKIALIIHRLEYYFSRIDLMDSSTDAMIAGLCVSNALTNLADVTNAAIIDLQTCVRFDYGVAGSAETLFRPIVKDFSNLPGGGLIVAPNPLYAFLDSTGLTAVATVSMRMYFTWKELGADEYWELVESRRVITG